MRTLLLISLLAPAVAAQDLRIVPTPDPPATSVLLDADRCDAPRSMPTPFDAEPGAAAVEMEMNGPEPVAMPNLCGSPAALAGNAAGPLGLRPGLDFERFRTAPPPIRERWELPYDHPQRRAVPDIDPDVLQRYLDRLPEGTDLLGRLAAPDAPVAPPEDRE